MSQLYLIIALALALALSVAANVHQLRAAAAADATASGTVDRVVDANAGCAAVTARLELDRTACEAQLSLDRAQSAESFAAHHRAIAEIGRKYADLRAEQARSQANECRDWAAQPTCGVTQ